MDGIKDWIDAIFKIGGTAGGLIAAFKAIAEMRLNRILRERDLRWKQAGSAKNLIDEMFDDPKAKAATLMLDWQERSYEIEGKTVEISRQDVVKALKTVNNACTGKDIYIRDCFDNFLYYIQLVEQSLVNQIFLEKDIQFPLAYYARIIQQPHLNKPFRDFLEVYHYDESIAFFRRYHTWESTSFTGLKPVL